MGVSSNNHKRKLLSVIVPVYNVEQYLERCVKSLIQQSYDNIEIILINDGSKDGSGELCDSLAKKYPGIKVIHKENGGVSSARNAGLNSAMGEYIAFVDPDDWVDIRMYETLISDIEDNHADAAFCYHKEAYDTHESSWKVCDKLRCVNQAEAMFACLAWPQKGGGYFSAIWNKVFRREVIFAKNSGTILFPKDYLISEDEVWLVQALSRCKKVVLDPNDFYSWYQRPGSALSNTGLNKHRMDEIRGKEFTQKYIKQNTEYKGLWDLVDANLFETAFILHKKYYPDETKMQCEYILHLMKESWKGWGNYHKVSLLGRAKKRIILTLIRIKCPTKIIALLDRIS